MFREMRRKAQQLNESECIEILENGSSGVLAVSGDDGYPYAVPLSYVFSDGKIYFHCAKNGHKLDGIRKDSKVSFCVIGQDNVIQSEFRTMYRSVIVFGHARIIEDEREIFNSIMTLSKKYCFDIAEEKHLAEIERFKKALCMVEINIEHITGKKSKDD